MVNITKEFLFGGHAVFTVSNPQGEHYTYRVASPDRQTDPQKPVYFLQILVGPDNTQDYKYAGLLLPTGQVVITRKSEFTHSDKSLKVATWAVKKVISGEQIPDGYKIQHAGKCGKCGRPLTTPESLLTGIGPVCSQRE